MNSINFYDEHPQENFIRKVLESINQLDQDAKQDAEFIASIISSFNPTEEQFEAFDNFLYGKFQKEETPKLNALYMNLGKSSAFKSCCDAMKILKQQLQQKQQTNNIQNQQQNEINNLTNMFEKYEEHQQDYEEHPQENFIKNVLDSINQLKQDEKRNAEFIASIISSFNPTEEQFEAFDQFLRGAFQKSTPKLHGLYISLGISSAFEPCGEAMEMLKQSIGQNQHTNNIQNQQQNGINNLTSMFENVNIKK